jgi:uncharacterized membrane protein HdeD (DUF308 family)
LCSEKGRRKQKNNFQRLENYEQPDIIISSSFKHFEIRRRKMSTAISAEEKTTPWWLVLINGIAALILGILLLTSTGSTVFILVQFLGIYWLIAGIFQIIGIFVDSSAWGWKLFAGILGILAGILVLNHPLWSALLVPTVLVLILGIQGIIFGVLGIIQAFQGAGWGAGILGALSIIFGIVLVANPVLGAAALPWVLGIFGIVGGIAAIIAAFRMR